MSKIPTGFRLNPLVGSIESAQLVSRYMKTNYFIDMLNKSAFWFTRIYNWQQMDPRESEMFPIFQKYLLSEFRDKYELNFFKAILEASIKLNYGCCFSIYEGNEKEHMWNSFTPEKDDFGVIILVRAEEINNAISIVSNKYQNVYFSKVKYLSAKKANSMQIKDCSHCNNETFIIEESHFLKRIEYLDENEVRAVISTKDGWNVLLSQFLEIEKISHYHSNAPVPKDCIRIQMRNSMVIDLLTDQVVFLTQEQGEKFILYIQKTILLMKRQMALRFHLIYRVLKKLYVILNYIAITKYLKKLWLR